MNYFQIDCKRYARNYLCVQKIALLPINFVCWDYRLSVTHLHLLPPRSESTIYLCIADKTAIVTGRETIWIRLRETTPNWSPQSTTSTTNKQFHWTFIYEWVSAVRSISLSVGPHSLFRLFVVCFCGEIQFLRVLLYSSRKVINFTLNQRMEIKQTGSRIWWVANSAAAVACNQ